MSRRPKPKDEEHAYEQLLEEFEAVTGKPADETARAVCRISAKRAMKDSWRWEKCEAAGWAARLCWN